MRLLKCVPWTGNWEGRKKTSAELIVTFVAGIAQVYFVLFTYGEHWGQLERKIHLHPGVARSSVSRRVPEVELPQRG
jgi:hypothetical protein